MNILIKWFLVVWLNTILGFLLGYNGGGKLYLTGMVLGVMTWYFIYVLIDYLLRASGREKESRRLFISALIRIPLQLCFVTDIYAGFAATFTLDFLGLDRHGNALLDAYLMTFFTGFYLSLFCGVIFLIITVIGNWSVSRRNLSIQ
jgi:ABC-type Na+ efflux pump permease subunit